MKHLIKYIRDPALAPRKIHWSLLRRFARDSQATVDTWNGRLTFQVADSLGKCLFVGRSWERDWIERGVKFLKEQRLWTPERDVVLDVGANLGMIAIAMLRQGYFQRAIAIEPEPNNFSLLEHNVKQNDLADRIDLEQLALSSDGEALELVLASENHGAHFCRKAGQSNDTARAVKVNGSTIDELLQTRYAKLIHRVGLVWMDVEGHEGECLAGARLLTERNIPVISEMIPRHIEANGMGRDRYLDIVKSRFDRFAVIAAGKMPTHAIDQLSALYDTQLGKERLDIINIVLWNA